MREQRNDPKRLRDILQAIDTVFQYIGDCDMQAFVADKKTYHAVMQGFDKAAEDAGITFQN